MLQVSGEIRKIWMDQMRSWGARKDDGDDKWWRVSPGSSLEQWRKEEGRETKEKGKRKGK